MTPDEAPSGSLMVDTMVFSWVLWRTRRHEEFRPFLDRALNEGHRLMISFATLGELYGGAAKARWPPERVAKLELAVRNFVVVPYSISVVRAYGPIHAQVAETMKNKGHNDMWTAACALALDENPAVVTDDLGDFRRIQAAVPALRLVHPDL